MADQQNRPRIFGKPLLQQVQCLQIQIVGRLIKHQQIGWQSKSTRQGQPTTLPAGQHADWRPGLLRAEQKILDVADDVACSAAYHHGVTLPRGQHLS